MPVQTDATRRVDFARCAIHAAILRFISGRRSPQPPGTIRVSSFGAASIVVVDLSAKNRILSTGWKSAEGVAWSPNGKEIWFTASRDGAGRALHAVTLSGKERAIARRLAMHD